jgi:hypothetical protein
MEICILFWHVPRTSLKGVIVATVSSMSLTFQINVLLCQFDTNICSNAYRLHSQIMKMVEGYVLCQKQSIILFYFYEENWN